MATLDQVDHLVNQDEFKTGCRLLDQFKIQPDPAGFAIARSPTGLHSLDANLSDLYPNPWLPLFYEHRQSIAELATIPFMKHSFP